MTYLVALLRPRRPGWPTMLALAGVVVVAASLALGSASLVLSTLGALVGATGFVLGVSASISTFFERDTYADSDFYR